MRLETLGVARLIDAGRGEATVMLALGKPLALLAYLSAAPGRSASRATLVSLLWGDLEPDSAKHALRQTLWYLRRKSGGELVTAAADVITLAPEVIVDRDAMLAASRTGDHEGVVALYRGPFLPSFAAPGGAGFEDWCALERRRLLEVFRHAAEAVVRARLAAGQARAALELARRIRDQDLYDESGWRLLLETCASAGDVLAGRAEAESLQLMAEREELQLEPASRAAIREARTRSSATGAGAEGAPQELGAMEGSLIGRETAFAALLDAWNTAREGRLVQVHITARPGIGKTRLLRDFAARLKAMRAKVVALGGTPGTREVAYGLAGDLAAGLATFAGKRMIAPESAATLVALNPSLSTYFETPPRHVAADEALRARTLALRELAAAVAFEHPVAILIDDLHWWDDASTSLVTAFASGVKNAAILLVTAGRPESLLSPLVAAEETRHMALEPLTVAQVDELVLSIAALPPEGWATEFSSALWRASRGSPLLALEMLQLLEDRALLRRDAGTWCTGSPEALSGELSGGDVLRARFEGMDGGDRWILTLLAVAGAPLDPALLVAAAERPVAEVAQRMAHLESRGLAARDEEGWRIAHDEISEEIFHLSPPDGTARAATCVGRALGGSGAGDGRNVRRAAQLLRSGDDPDARAELLLRFLRARYEMGDRRTVRALTADLFGTALPPAEMRVLESAAPWSWRAGLVSTTRRLAAGGVAAVIVAALAAFALARPATSDPDAVLGLVYATPEGRVEMRAADLFVDDWQPFNRLATRVLRIAEPFEVVSSNALSASFDPRTGTMVTSQTVDDDGVIDLFLHERGRAPRRIGSAPGDDLHPAISPDGRNVAFNTARWDTLSRYDIAVMSLADEHVTRLTSSPSSDNAPRWSPDGRRVAFSRSNWGTGPNELCVVAIADPVPSCDAAQGTADRHALGWLDEDRIVFEEADGNTARLLVMRWSDRTTSIVAEGTARHISLSPDGGWVFCRCPSRTSSAPRPAVFPLAAPELVRELYMDPATSLSPSIFWVSSRSTLEPAKVVIVGPARVPVGVPMHFRARLTDLRGRSLLHLGNVRWWVSDSVNARIDPIAGTLHGERGAAEVTVFVAAGRDARDSMRVAIDDRVSTPAFEERWDDESLGAWLPFGRPAPSVARGSDGTRAFRNNGDGSFTSGVLSRRSFDASRGLAVDVRFSARVTLSQWQTFNVGLYERADTVQFARTRGRNVHPTHPIEGMACDLGMPSEGGRGTPEEFHIVSRNNSLGTPISDPTLLSGGWHDLRLQLFPDGRCGFAVNGIAIGVVDGERLPHDSVRVSLSGNSYRTDVLAGALKVYEGVPDGVDWTKARERR